MIRNKTGRFFNVMNDFFCFIIDSKATIIQTLLWFNLRVKFYFLAGRKSKKLTSTPMIIYFIHFSRARTISLSGKSHKISQKMRKKDSGLPASTKSRKRYIEPAVPKLNASYFSLANIFMTYREVHILVSIESSN